MPDVARNHQLRLEFCSSEANIRGVDSDLAIKIGLD